MTTEKKAVTIYLDPSVYEKLKESAVIEERSVSNRAAMIIAEKLYSNAGKGRGDLSQYHGDVLVADEVEERSRGVQVDIEEAIAATRKRVPVKRASRHK